MNRLARLLCVAVFVSGGSVLGMPTATAADGGLLRLAHLSPDTPPVDVYVNSVADPKARVVLRAVGYGMVSDYREVPVGVYTVAMRAAGARADTPPVLSTAVQVGPHDARTVAGVGHFAHLELKILQDDLTPPPSGQARVRVIAAAATAGPVDVSRAGGPQIATHLAFASMSAYVDIPGGQTLLTVQPQGGRPTELRVVVSPGAVYSLLVLDRSGGGLTVRPVLDAAGMGVVPLGGMATGAGGAVTGFPRSPVALGIAALAAVGLCLTAVGRLPRHGAAPRHAAAQRHAAKDGLTATPRNPAGS
jgi:hypothetical protein